MAKRAMDAWAEIVGPGSYGAVYREGVTRRSQHAVLAPLHIVVRDGNADEWLTWCTAAPALDGLVHPQQKRCRKCASLANERASDEED